MIYIPFSTNAQLHEPVQWETLVNYTDNNEAEILFEANIEEKWHIFAQSSNPKGSMPLSINFENNNNFELIGKLKEPKPIEEFDDVFQVYVRYFVNNVTFKQKIKILSEKSFIINGTIDYQSCIDGMCVPGSFDFDLNIKGAKNTIQKVFDTTNIISKKNIDNNSLNINDTLDTNKLSQHIINVSDDNEANKTDKSIWALFLFAFLAGLAAILTPCVFPMIPMTVSFFMHDSDKKRKAKIQASFFGLSIILIYTVIGTIVALTLGVNFANWLSTHWIPNVLFFLIFLIFAASFLGMFEITLPSWLISKSDKQADKGGIGAPFFMAFTLVLVSFSCTGPLVGAILVATSRGEVIEPIIGMLGFSLAFAIPFTFFAFFPSLLSKMPKSGGWLNSVKVFLGFLELALGLKFLSIADQTYHWGILDREVYLALWIIIFTLLGLYLIGKLKLKHDDGIKHVGVPRLLTAIIVFSFVVYMIPGMFGAPLKAMAGYLPPQQTIDFDLNRIIRENKSGIENIEKNELCNTPKYSDFLHLPHGLKGYFDYEEGRACAEKLNKPIFLDFTGHGCVNCREMEANVWANPEVLKILKEQYIIIALYVDDKSKLPENEWSTSLFDGKIKKSLGKKYADFQISFFNVNAQPYYVLLDPTFKLEKPEDVSKALLVKPVAYDLNSDNFVNFLNSGLNEFKKRNN